MDEAAWHASLKLTGEIEIGVYGEIAKLTGLELERRDGVVRVTLRGPVGELRKLAPLSPSYAAMLVHLARENAAQEGLLKLVSKRDLAEEIARGVEAVGEAATPDDWLRDPTLANLLFALDRYEVEASGTVTRG